MECINSGCNMNKGCNIKEVAQHCIIHKKMIMGYKDSFDEQGLMNSYSGFMKPTEKVDSYDDTRED